MVDFGYNKPSDFVTDLIFWQTDNSWLPKGMSVIMEYASYVKIIYAYIPYT